MERPVSTTGPAFGPPSTDTSELLGTPESLGSPKVMDIILQRHGEKGPDGWLTEKGVEEVKAETERLIEPYLVDGATPVTFFVLNSPSASWKDGVEMGKRAEHTGRVSADVIKERLAGSGIPPEKAEFHEFNQGVEGTRPHKALSEPNYYFVDGSTNPTGYFDALVAKGGKEGREEAFFAEPDELEETRKEVGAESSTDVSDRVLHLAKVIERYGDLYRQSHPDRKLVFILESHGDVIRSTVQHGLGVEDSVGWQPHTGEAVRFQLADGQFAVSYNGGVYETTLRK